MNTNMKSFFFISGSVFFTVLIASQFYNYYQMSKVTAQFSKSMNEGLKQNAGSLASELSLPAPATAIIENQSSVQPTQLSAFTKTSSLDTQGVDATKQAAATIPSAESKLQDKEEINRLTTELNQVNALYSNFKALLNHCTGVELSANRLDCFDRLTREKEHFGDTPKNWVIEKSISPLDDTTSISLTVNARETLQSYGNKKIRPIFFVSCDTVGSTVMFSTGQYFARGYKQFVTRIGKGKANSLNWRMNKEGESAYLEGPRQAFIQALIDSDRLAIQYGSRTEPDKVLTFDLTGLNHESSELKAACGV